MSLYVTGKLHKVFPTEKKTDTFQAREFVLEVAGQYTQWVKFQLVQDRCDLIDNYHPGLEITVHFDLRGREWVNADGETKYFTNLNAWRLEPVAQQEGQPQPPASPEPEPEPAGSPEAQEAGLTDNDLPF